MGPETSRRRPLTLPHVPGLWEREELVEILIRIPPDEPADLIRVSLVCKAWCRLLSGHVFRGRYRTLHKTPPVLGFLQSWDDNVERFVPTTKFRPRNPNRRDSFVLDCRHGRVLLGCEWDREDEEEEEEKEVEDVTSKMIVWEPVSGSRTELHNIFGPDMDCTNYSATVLCAANGCNHTACNLGPFFVVVAFVSLRDKRLVLASVCVYSSKTREWTSPASIHIGGVGTLGAYIVARPAVIVGQALHFLLRRDEGICILKYDLVREMDLKTLVPIGSPRTSYSLKLVGCVEGTDIILAITYLGAFRIDLKSLRLRKLSSKPNRGTIEREIFENLFLYMSFNNPPAVASSVAVAEASEAGRHVS
uniref:F-box domain-containing protein n=1 Tax=Aegilops tauschii TaxID=37682 RepID=M8B4R9_AEGTA